MSEPIEFLTWKWRPVAGYRSRFDANTVNVLRSMLERNYRKPHRLTCITDDPEGIDSRVRVLPMKTTYANVRNPSNARNPSCYRRLWAFSEEARKEIGTRIVSLDLDVVITGDVTDLFDRQEEFVIWGGQAIDPKKRDPYCWYNGSLWYLRAGTRTKVWNRFHPGLSPILANRAGNRGSDQGWIAYCLGPNESKFTFADGVHSFRNHILPNGGQLLPNTKFVSFHGRFDPWQEEVKRQFPWVKEHYQ